MSLHSKLGHVAFRVVFPIFVYFEICYPVPFLIIEKPLGDRNEIHNALSDFSKNKKCPLLFCLHSLYWFLCLLYFFQQPLGTSGYVVLCIKVV